jgi:hypothetical protein
MGFQTKEKDKDLGRKLSLTGRHAPQTEKSSSIFKSLRKKGSKASLLSMASDVTVKPPAPFPEISRPSPLRAHTSPATMTETPAASEDEQSDDEDMATSKKFINKDRLIVRNGMRVHPYPNEAPYPQAYEQISLDKYVQSVLPHANLFSNLICHYQRSVYRLAFTPY